MAAMAVDMDTILIEMSKMWTVTDRHTDGPWSTDQGISPGELTIENLQQCCCAGHHGYRNKMFLAILNLHVTPMPPTKFWLNLIYHQGADEVWRFSRWPSWGPSQISDQNNFSNSESLCHSDAADQVWVQSTLRFGRRCHLKNFNLRWENGTNLAVLNLHSPQCLPLSFSSIMVLEEMSKMWKANDGWQMDGPWTTGLGISCVR